MNKNIVFGVIAVVIAGTAFYGGDVYGKGGSRQFGQGAFAQGNFARQGSMGMRGTMGGFSAGEILSKDARSITLKMQNGSTKIVLIGTSTEVFKNVSSSAGDLSVGADVTVTGVENSDGSVTAQSVQIRPAGATRPVQAQ